MKISQLSRRFKISFVVAIVCLLACIYYLTIILSNPPEHVYNSVGKGIIVFSIIGSLAALISLYYLPRLHLHGED